MERLYTLIVDIPNHILVVLLVVTGLFVYPALSVRLDSSVDSLLRSSCTATAQLLGSIPPINGKH